MPVNAPSGAKPPKLPNRAVIARMVETAHIGCAEVDWMLRPLLQPAVVLVRVNANLDQMNLVAYDQSMALVCHTERAFDPGQTDLISSLTDALNTACQYQKLRADISWDLFLNNSQLPRLGISFVLPGTGAINCTNYQSPPGTVVHGLFCNIYRPL